MLGVRKFLCRGSKRPEQIQLSSKTGLPILSRREQSNKADNLGSHSDDLGTIRVPTARKPDESIDEKKERKGAVKEAKVGYTRKQNHDLCTSFLWL